MYKKLGKATNLLLTLVFFLVAVVSVVLTVKFIDPPFTVETEEETEEVILKVEEDRDEQMVSTNTGNIFQHYENSEKFGLVDCNNKYVFKYQVLNSKPCLTRTSLKNDSMDIVLTGYEIKNLNIVKNKLYMVVQQYIDEYPTEVIAYMDVEKTNFTPINETRMNNIYSYMSDGKNIFYTTTDDYWIYMVNKDGFVSKVYQTNKNAEPAFIIGIKDGLIYYVNGQELCSVGIHSRQFKQLSTQYCSVEQYPIIVDDSILCFYDLNHTRVDFIDLDGRYKQTLVEKGQTKEIRSRIDSLNYSCGYIFLLADDEIFYLNKNDYSINKLTEAKPKTEQMCFTDEYLILEGSELGTPVAHKLSWLFAS